MGKTKEVTPPIKKLILQAPERNISIHQVSTELNISKSAAGAILKKYREM